MSRTRANGSRSIRALYGDSDLPGTDCGAYAQGVQCLASMSVLNQTSQSIEVLELIF